MNATRRRSQLAGRLCNRGTIARRGVRREAACLREKAENVVKLANCFDFQYAVCIFPKPRVSNLMPPLTHPSFDRLAKIDAYFLIFFSPTAHESFHFLKSFKVVTMCTVLADFEIAFRVNKNLR